MQEHSEPSLESPRIKQEGDTLLSAEALAHETNVVLLCPSKAPLPAGLPYRELLQRRTGGAHARRSPLAAGPLVFDLPTRPATRVALARFDAEMSAHERLALARKLVDAHRHDRPRRLVIACYGLEPELARGACEAVMAAALAASFKLPEFKREPEPTWALREIALYGCRASDGFARTLAAARGNNLARYLTALPANTLTPATYRRRLQRLARRYHWKMEFYDVARLRRLGAGAFLAVAQGSPQADAGIARLRYVPSRNRARPALALVGKGICFDTGGTNLKTAKHMHGMHEDMAGSAVALGCLLALTELKVGFPVDCWLALAQNHIGPEAYRPNEVVRAANGTTIEVVHTDAEGRMVLADTLTLATMAGPRTVIDYATLTGACVAALGTRVSGVFTNRPERMPVLIRAGEESGERVWPFPLFADYDESLRSEIADIKQCTLDNEADHILGAAFLKRFLSGNPEWVHVDLSAGHHKGGLGYVPTDITGFGVRYTLNLLLDQRLMR